MKIGIVGLGYVGLPLAVAFAEAGHEVVGARFVAEKVEALKAGAQLRRGHPRRDPGRTRRPPGGDRDDTALACLRGRS